MEDFIMENTNRTNTINLIDHGTMLSAYYFNGTGGVMIPITVDNKTTIKQAIDALEQEFIMLFDLIESTAEYHGFIGNLDKQLDKIISDLKKENREKMNDIIKPDLDFNFDTESQDDLDMQEYPVMILSLEFEWEEPETYTISELEKMRISKGELFKDMEKIKTFDYTLPQEWLNNFSLWCKMSDFNINYELIRSTTVWLYPENKPVSMCTEVQEQIDKWLDMQYGL